MHLRRSNNYFEWYWIFGLHFLQINIVFCFNSSTDNIDAWKKLNEPKYIVAPMVDLSDLAWRILCRRHGAQLCYTEMLFSKLFAASRKYRKKHVLDCPEDKPLIVQFCGNDPKILLEAVLKLDTKVDGVDINLGCPQMCAKRSKYGAFLQDDWKLISRMVKILHENVNIPVSCKIRVFPEIGKSIDYARMLEDSGCQLLTVHGRTREQVRENSGLASWKHIKAIRQSVNIPVFANGNIRCLNDIHRCLQETGCNGVMSAEGILHNPALFEGSNCTVWEAALEYMELVELYTTPLTSIRGHLFKLFVHLFTVPENSILRTKLGQAFRQKDFVDIILKIKERYEPIHNSKHFQENEHFTKMECHPPWICHSYTRHSSKNQSQFFHKMINPSKERRNKRKISV